MQTTQAAKTLGESNTGIKDGKISTQIHESLPNSLSVPSVSLSLVNKVTFKIIGRETGQNALCTWESSSLKCCRLAPLAPLTLIRCLALGSFAANSCNISDASLKLCGLNVDAGCRVEQVFVLGLLQVMTEKAQLVHGRG